MAAPQVEIFRQPLFNVSAKAAEILEDDRVTGGHSLIQCLPADPPVEGLPGFVISVNVMLKVKIDPLLFTVAFQGKAIYTAANATLKRKTILCYY